MTSAPTRARRPVSRAAARWTVLAALIALALGLGMGFARASADASLETADAVAGAGHHAPVLRAVAAADDGCPGCIDHEQGAMVACLVTLVVVALIAALRPSPAVQLVLRRPLERNDSSLPREPGRAPDLAALGICRT